MRLVLAHNLYAVLSQTAQHDNGGRYKSPKAQSLESM